MLHKTEIHGGFLSSLGVNVLSRLYKALASSPHVITIVARVDGEIEGFICGGVDVGKVYRRFLCRECFLVLPALLPKLFSKRILWKLFELLFYPNKFKQLYLPKAEILNFCVSSNRQGLGIGRKLFAKLMDDLWEHSVQEVTIVTGVEQTSAQRFYESAGAQLVTKMSVHGNIESLAYKFIIGKQDK